MELGCPVRSLQINNKYIALLIFKGCCNMFVKDSNAFAILFRVIRYRASVLHLGSFAEFPLFRDRIHGNR